MSEVESTATNRAHSGVITVTLNPAVDLFVSVDDLHPGELHRVDTPLQHPGGKGINVSRMLAELQVPTIATGFLGGDRGAWIANELRKLGITSDFVDIKDETRINVKVIDGKGTLTELNSPAPHIDRTEATEFDTQLRRLVASNKWIAFCGNLPEGYSETWYYDAILQAKAAGIGTLLDASGTALAKGVEARPDVIKPNIYELSKLTGRELNSIEEVMQAAAGLVRSGIGMIVVSMGADGLAAVTASQSVHVRVPEVPIVSSVGAGDTAVAALLCGLYHGRVFEDCIRYAAAAGTAKVGQPGTKHPTKQNIEVCLRDTEIQHWRGLA